MALTKEKILVWMSAVKDEQMQTICLMAWPAGRKKDLYARLQTAAAKKVRGQRLDSLSLQEADDASIPYLMEYVQAVRNLPSLFVFAAKCGRKGALAMDEALKEAAQALKTHWPQAQFEVFSDEKQIRSSHVQSWMRKYQLDGQAVSMDEENSRALKTAALLGSVLFLETRPNVQKEDPDALLESNEPASRWSEESLKSLQAQNEKLRLHVQIDPSWHLLDVEDVYAKLLAQNNGSHMAQDKSSKARPIKKARKKKATPKKESDRSGESLAAGTLSSDSADEKTLRAQFAVLFALQPQWKKGSLLERWMKKGLQPGTLEALVELAGKQMPYESLSTLNPAKIEAQYGKLMEEQDRKNQSLDEQALKKTESRVLTGIQKLEKTILDGALPKRAECLASYFEQDAFQNDLKTRVRTVLTKWSAASLSNPPRKSLLLIEEENGLYGYWLYDALNFSMRLGDPDVFREIENERSIHMEYDQLGDWISKISKIRPLCRIYACPSVLKGIRRHLLLENAYLPLSVLTDEQEKQLRQIQTITKDGNDSDRAAGTADPQNLLFLSDKGMQTEGPAVSFLDPETFDRLSRKEKKRLLDLPLELDELRLTARLLLAGVSFLEMQDTLQQQGSLLRLADRVLLPYPKRKWVEEIRNPEIAQIFLSKSLKPSARQEIISLVHGGLSGTWMNENLHSNMSAAKIERIVKGYPGNRLPRGWIDAAQKVEEIQTGKDPENEGEEYPSASSKWIVLDSVLAGQMLDKRAAFFPESSALERMEQLALLDASLASNVLLETIAQWDTKLQDQTED